MRFFNFSERTILGIETSCDETAVAIVRNGTEVLISLIASSIAKHQQYGGVVPEIAARDQIKQIIPLIQQSLKQTNLKWDEIDAIAVTESPGLISSLLVGINTAQTLAWLKQKPLLKINHIYGHIYANWLEKKTLPQFPILILTVSGGHNELVLMKDFNSFELIGESLDDAAGEAFDKVAKMLDLGYPGGPVISKLAQKGNPEAYNFPQGLKQKDNFNFSFSGLKTAVLYTLRDIEEKITKQIKADIAASFQESVCESLSNKLIRAAEKLSVREIHLAGGVSANQLLRQKVADKIKSNPKLNQIKFRFPAKIKYCTDNAAMIAAAGFYLNCQNHEE